VQTIDGGLVLTTHTIILGHPFPILVLPLLLLLLVFLHTFLVLLLVVDFHEDLLLSQILAHPFYFKLKIRLKYFELLLFAFALLATTHSGW